MKGVEGVRHLAQIILVANMEIRSTHLAEIICSRDGVVVHPAVAAKTVTVPEVQGFFQFLHFGFVLGLSDLHPLELLISNCAGVPLFRELYDTSSVSMNEVVFLDEGHRRVPDEMEPQPAGLAVTQTRARGAVLHTFDASLGFLSERVV